LNCPLGQDVNIVSYDLKFNLKTNPERDCYTEYDYSISKPGAEFEMKCMYDLNLRSSCRLSAESVRSLFRVLNIQEIYHPLPKRATVKYRCSSKLRPRCWVLA